MQRLGNFSTASSDSRHDTMLVHSLPIIIYFAMMGMIYFLTAVVNDVIETADPQHGYARSPAVSGLLEINDEGGEGDGNDSRTQTRVN